MFPFHCISVKIFRLEISQNQRDSVANFGNYYRSQLLKCQLTFSLPNANSKIMQNQLGTIELATLIKGILKIGNCCCPTITGWKTRKPPSHFMKPQIGIWKWYYPVRKHLWAARLTKDCIVPFFDWFPMVSAQAVRTYGKNIWIGIVLALNKTLLMRVLVLKLNFSNEIVKVGNTDFHCNENWQFLILLLKCQRQLYNVYTRPFCVKTTHVCLNRWKPNIDSMTCIEPFYPTQLFSIFQ